MCVCQTLGKWENVEMGVKNDIWLRKWGYGRLGFPVLRMRAVLGDGAGRGEAFLRTKQKRG